MSKVAGLAIVGAMLQKPQGPFQQKAVTLPHTHKDNFLKDMTGRAIPMIYFSIPPRQGWRFITTFRFWIAAFVCEFHLWTSPTTYKATIRKFWNYINRVWFVDLPFEHRKNSHAHHVLVRLFLFIAHHCHGTSFFLLLGANKGGWP